LNPCGQRGPLSREDAFPHWLIKAIGGDHPVDAVPQFVPAVGDGGPIDRHVFGSAAVYKLRDVCAPCNNVWLKKLEDAVAPALKMLVAGEDVAIPPAVQAIIGCWAYKTAVVFDACQAGKGGGRRIAAEQGTRRFYDDGQPPPGSSVWLGRFSRHGLEGFGLPHHRLQLDVPPGPGENSAERLTFVFAHLLVQVVAPHRPGPANPFVSYELADADIPLVRCWPPAPDEIVFPNRAVSMEHLDRVCFAEARLR